MPSVLFLTLALPPCAVGLGSVYFPLFCSFRCSSSSPPRIPRSYATIFDSHRPSHRRLMPLISAFSTKLLLRPSPPSFPPPLPPPPVPFLIFFRAGLLHFCLACSTFRSLVARMVRGSPLLSSIYTAVRRSAVNARGRPRCQASLGLRHSSPVDCGPEIPALVRRLLSGATPLRNWPCRHLSGANLRSAPLAVTLSPASINGARATRPQHLRSAGWPCLYHRECQVACYSLSHVFFPQCAPALHKVPAVHTGLWVFRAFLEYQCPLSATSGFTYLAPLRVSPSCDRHWQNGRTSLLFKTDEERADDSRLLSSALPVPLRSLSPLPNPARHRSALTICGQPPSLSLPLGSLPRPSAASLDQPPGFQTVHSTTTPLICGSAHPPHSRR